MVDIVIKDNDDKVAKLSKPELGAFETVHNALTKIKKHAASKSILRACSTVLLEQFKILEPHLSTSIDLDCTALAPPPDAKSDKKKDP